MQIDYSISFFFVVVVVFPTGPQPDELQQTSDAEFEMQEESIAMGRDEKEDDEGAEPEQMAITSVDVAMAKDEVSFDFLISLI